MKSVELSVVRSSESAVIHGQVRGHDRGVEHDIRVRHGGRSLHHTGSAEISLYLEQDRARTTGPVITLSVVVRGIEQEAWLTSAETTALHRILGQLVGDATGEDQPTRTAGPEPYD